MTNRDWLFLDSRPYGQAARYIEAVCRETGVERTDLTSDQRHQPVARIRQLCMYILHRRCKLTSPVVGRMLGDRDHSTVLAAVKKVDALLDSDPELAALYQRIISHDMAETA